MTIDNPDPDEEVGLQRQRKLLVAKLNGLRPAHAVETNPAAKLLLEVQIEAAEADLAKVDEELDRLSVQPGWRALRGALLSLDFQSQATDFSRFFREHPVGAFLIHGEPNFGQRWVLNRLVRTRITNARKIPVSLGFVGRPATIEAMWRELAGRVGLKSSASVKDIVDTVHGLRATQTVVIVLDQAQNVPDAHMRQIVTQFWGPLASSAAPPNARYKLLLFLVDHEGVTATFNLGFAERFDQHWEASVPIKLPALARIGTDVLEGWIVNSIDRLSARFWDDPAKAAQEIHEESDEGIPEDVLITVCEWSDLSYYDLEGQWLTL